MKSVGKACIVTEIAGWYRSEICDFGQPMRVFVPFGRNGEFAGNESQEQPKMQTACKNYLRNRKEYVISKHIKAAKVYSTSFSP